MPTTLRYGRDSTLTFDIAPSKLLADCGAPAAEAVGNVRQAVADVLAAPLDFPPLSQAIIPGDRIVLALEPSVPQAGVIVAAVVDLLLEAGAKPDDVTIVRAQPSSEANSHEAEDLREHFSDEYRDLIEIVVHDPMHRDQLSYLAADESSEPVYVNRRLFDADIVLPIGCLRLGTAWDYYGVNGTLCPTFSDQATLDRFRAAGVADNLGDAAKRRHEADELAWLLGVMLTIQVVPGPEGKILHVLAGSTHSVQRRGAELCEAAWEFETPRRAELVVAAVDGDANQQTWENFGRAIAAATRAVNDDGAIAVCMELSEAPGPALQTISGAHDLHDAERTIRCLRTADAPAAHELVRALQRCRVYLLSQLDETTVEDLGIAHIAAAEEVERLAERHRSCTLLGSAQFAQAVVAGEAVERAAT
jgi:nickel-dependent lactate racemase